MTSKTSCNRVARGALALVGGLLAWPGLASAAGGVPELEGPIQRFAASISGPIALAIATIVVVGAGLAWASSEGMGFHRITNWVLGISVAMFAVTILSTVWTSQAAATPVLALTASWGSLLLEDLASLSLHAWLGVCGLWGSLQAARHVRLGSTHGRTA